MADDDVPAVAFDAQINVKMSRDLKERLRKIEERHGTPVPEILRRLGAAAAMFFEENGYLTFPASIVPEIFSPPVRGKKAMKQKKSHHLCRTVKTHGAGRSAKKE